MFFLFAFFLFYIRWYLDFGFIYECFPSLAIWPTYCILLSTFFSVFSNLSVFDLPVNSRNLWTTFYFLPFTFYFVKGGDEGTRTPGLCLAKAPLSQLSYIPFFKFRIMNSEFWIIFVILNSELWIIFVILNSAFRILNSPVGLSGLEPETSPLSEARSNQLS